MTPLVTRVKGWALLLLVAAACRGTGSVARPGNALTGAPAPRLAVEQFLASVRAQDLQAMSLVWGDEQGPARERIERIELEKREIIMQCFFEHDKFRVLGEVGGAQDRRVFRVELTKGANVVVRAFTTAKGPGERWYVADAEMTGRNSPCRQRS